MLSVIEIWLTESCINSFLEIPGFCFHQSDVVGEVRKHGAGFYVYHILRPMKVDVSISNIVAVHLIDYNIQVRYVCL